MIDEQHHERAKIDAKASTDFGRAAAQSAILINGGAATAILALFGSVARDPSSAKSLVPLIPIPLSIYALGVLFAACALLPMSKALEWYMTNWERKENTTREIVARYFGVVGYLLLPWRFFASLLRVSTLPTS